MEFLKVLILIRRKEGISMKLIHIIFLRLRAITGKIWLIIFLLVALSLSFFVADAITSPGEVTSLNLAVVDTDNSRLSNELVSSLATLDGLSITETSNNDAYLLLAEGSIEGILFIDYGYEDTLIEGVGQELPIRYESAATAATRTAAREMIAGQVISQRSLLRAKGELNAAGVTFTEEDLANAISRFNENTEPLYNFTVYMPGAAPTVPGINGLFAGYLGFVSLVIILIMMTLSQWFAKHDSRAVASRMAILKHGRLLSFYGDVLLLFAVGSIVVLLAYLSSTFTSLEVIYLLAYVYCITGLCLVLSRFQVAGSIDIMAPLIALFTSILGGSFMDLGSLSPVMQTLSLFTPQGQMLYGVSHDVIWTFWLLMGMGSLFLTIVYTKNRKLSPRKCSD
jgi:hypothetical protein